MNLFIYEDLINGITLFCNVKWFIVKSISFIFEFRKTRNYN